MKEVLLLKCGEIVLKGLNRKTFEDRLLKNLKRRMAHVADCEITMRQSVVYVEIPDDADADAVMECASRVFGFATISRAAVCPEKTLESVIATARDYLAPNFAAAKTFKVESKRGDKKFPMTSTEISQHVGGELADLFPDVRPDMHHPDLTVHVEMREKYAFVHAGPVPGAGGMPIGSNGRAALLLSGGIDSPVAGWMMAKRGLELCGIHFFSYPYTSERAKEKVLELGRKLTAWCGRMSVMVVPFTHIQEEIRDKCHEELFTLIMRRFMMRIAERVAVEYGCGALITGEGSIEFAGGTITLKNSNDYTGNTYVTDGELVLAADEALGDSALLKVTGSGTVSVGSTAQSIGSISVAGENGLSMAGGSLTLTSGASTISSANNVSGTFALSGKGTTLTIQNASGVGGSGTTISLSDDTSVIFAGAGFANAGTYAKINNELSGSGTVQIGDGVASTYLELLNKNNAFGKLLVTNGATVLVNDMHADNAVGDAVGDAAVNIESGGIARLYGSSGWTFDNKLNLVKGGELVLAANDGVVNFSGTDQTIDSGTVTLRQSVLYLGGSSGATNAAVLDTAHLNVGSNGVLHVATGKDAQVLDKLTLGSSGHIWFDGTLGVSGTGTTQLGQLKVGSLGDMKGTIHLTASSAAGSGGEIKAAELLNVADSGSFQSLIEVTGTDTITDAELSGTKLDVSGNTSVVSDIKDGSGNTVAEGTFGLWRQACC